ncbi:40S ribosomal protein S24e [Trypanosoma cruzi]|nr:40S ribosomal protein S24e [Trypanosoma cruzi]
MRLSINQCFPDPLARQWPATHHPVLCECRQLYVLVSICCCVPSAHLLVLHDGMSNSTVTSMPKGPTYLELRITEQTRREAFCGFLMRAESASTASAPNGFVEETRQVTVVCLQELSAASSQVFVRVDGCVGIWPITSGEYSEAGALTSHCCLLRRADIRHCTSRACT